MKTFPGFEFDGENIYPWQEKGDKGLNLKDGILKPYGGFVMPPGLPVMPEKAHHATVADFPKERPVFFNLSEGWA